jgi:hypothetical protein
MIWWGEPTRLRNAFYTEFVSVEDKVPSNPDTERQRRKERYENSKNNVVAGQPFSRTRLLGRSVPFKVQQGLAIIEPLEWFEIGAII